MNGEWWFAQAGEAVGPTTFSHLVQLAAQQPDLLVWCEGMPSWTPAREVFRQLADRLNTAPPPLPLLAGPVSAPVGNAAMASAAPLPQPVRRFLARLFDSYLFLVLFNIAMDSRVPWEGLTGYQLLSWISVGLLVRVPFEALFGRSLGKRLHGVAFAGPVPLNTRLRRALSVWFRGLGGGFLPFTIATSIVCYNRLAQNRVTSWDADLGVSVIYTRNPWWRIVLVVIVWAIVLFPVAVKLVNRNPWPMKF